MIKPLVLTTIKVNKRNPKCLDKEKYPILAIYCCDGAMFGESLYLVDGEFSIIKIHSPMKSRRHKPLRRPQNQH